MTFPLPFPLTLMNETGPATRTDPADGSEEEAGAGQPAKPVLAGPASTEPGERMGQTRLVGFVHAVVTGSIRRRTPRFWRQS